MQQIIVKDLKVKGYIGCFDYEKFGQPFLVNIYAKLAEVTAENRDDLTYTADYSALVSDVLSYFENAKCDLIENALEELSDIIFRAYDSITDLRIEIFKTAVELGCDYERIGVSVHRKISTAYIALGTNIGDDLNKQLDFAIDRLLSVNGIRSVKESTRIVSKPYGFEKQDDFLNSVCEIKTYLSPNELLDELHRIEHEAKRERDIHWGPRTLDLDIILFENEVISSPELCVPHIDMQNRRFVLAPLVELNPYAYNPVLKMRAIDLLKELDDEV